MKEVISMNEQVRLKLLKISNKLIELNDMLDEEKFHLAPAAGMEIEEECKKLTEMLWKL